MTIPNLIQEVVRQRANFRCEYCHYPEFLSTSPLTIDHIMPQSLGGNELQSRLDELSEKNKAVRLTPEEEAELTGILELDRIFTLLNARIIADS